MTSPEQQSAYIEAQNKCGLKVGDRVRIYRICLTEENDWSDAWVGQMDSWVGRNGQITEDKGKRGFRVSMECESRQWNFPYFVLQPLPGERALLNIPT